MREFKVFNYNFVFGVVREVRGVGKFFEFEADSFYCGGRGVIVFWSFSFRVIILCCRMVSVLVGVRVWGGFSCRFIWFFLSRVFFFVMGLFWLESYGLVFF